MKKKILAKKTLSKNSLFSSDRFRTAINIIGDALGASIITQFYEIALEKEKTRRLESIEKAICKTRT